MNGNIPTPESRTIQTPHNRRRLLGWVLFAGCCLSAAAAVAWHFHRQALEQALDWERDAGTMGSPSQWNIINGVRTGLASEVVGAAWFVPATSGMIPPALIAAARMRGPNALPAAPIVANAPMLCPNNASRFVSTYDRLASTFAHAVMRARFSGQ